eukprot:Skav224094  [mRNA]  locus=scaffold4565:48599:53186:- [translate_table: standard]
MASCKGSPLPRANFVNDVGYLPDGTPMNMAGNAINHPDSGQAKSGDRRDRTRPWPTWLFLWFTRSARSGSARCLHALPWLTRQESDEYDEYDDTDDYSDEDEEDMSPAGVPELPAIPLGTRLMPRPASWPGPRSDRADEDAPLARSQTLPAKSVWFSEDLQEVQEFVPTSGGEDIGEDIGENIGGKIGEDIQDDLEPSNGPMLPEEDGDDEVAHAVPEEEKEESDGQAGRPGAF